MLISYGISVFISMCISGFTWGWDFECDENRNKEGVVHKAFYMYLVFTFFPLLNIPLSLIGLGSTLGQAVRRFIEKE